MPAEPEAKGDEDVLEQTGKARAGNGKVNDARGNGDQDKEEEEEDNEEEEDEPRLKYTKLTGSLSSVYRNGDASSTFMVGGDKMVIGTHNGNIHVFQTPGLQPLRLYHAHSASITAVSISPVPAVPAANSINPGAARIVSDSLQPPKSPSVKPGSPATPKTPRQQPALPNVPSNQIYIASASIDGHVCVSSLLDPNDVTLRNFARPVQAVALSPDYKNDRTYLSGGLAGNLIVTVGGKSGVSADANTNSAAAAASGWLGSIGLGSNTGRDNILHSGEGSISTIKFSRTSRYVAWINEHGIKIMRSHLKLESIDADSAWKRIAHIDRPNRGAWEDMASVWKGRADWISDKNLETDEATDVVSNGANTPPSKAATPKRRPEKLVVGWGDTAWILHVHPGGAGVGRHVGERSVGSADIVHKLTFDDCVISGLSLYTPSLLAVLAYRTRDDNDNPVPSSHRGTPRRHRQSGLSPEVRLINAQSGDELDVDTLTVSRYESLSASDYHLGTIFVPSPQQSEAAQRGALESLNAGFWEVGSSATRLFSSGASVTSAANSGENGRASVLSPNSAMGNSKLLMPIKQAELNPSVVSTGLKLFIHSPYDCVLSVKRSQSDHLDWLMENKKYGKAWELIDEHPTIVGADNDRRSIASSPSTPSKGRQGSLADFFADDSASQTTVSANKSQNSAAAKEKRRVGDLWIQQLVSANDWEQAGKVAGKVLGTSTRWEHWVLAFAQADRFDEITPYIPSTDLKPPLPSFVYEVVLGHYISYDRPRFAELLEQWDPELFDITSIISAIESKIDSGDVSENTIDEGEQGRDWRILLNGLAKLCLAAGNAREALRCYIRLQNSDAAMALIRDYHLVDAVADDIPGLLLLRISREQLKSGNIPELQDASSEAVQLLVDEAYSGAVHSSTVVEQLVPKGKQYHPFLYFYFASLWRGPKLDEDRIISKVERLNRDRQKAEGQMGVEAFADLALSLFADYDRDLLMDYLRHSVAYSLDKASSICENRHYIPELVYLLSKTGETRQALFLIIGELGDVSQAISFAKEHPDLWDDLLDYSMDKPPFIRALLSEVGTAINPIQLIRRIPDGLEIEGLKEGVQSMVREYDIQYSISEGVAKVFRGEVASGMDTLRAGQKRGVKFEVKHSATDEVQVKVDSMISQVSADAKKQVGISDDTVVKQKGKEAQPGHCVGCGDVFEEEEHDFLVGFACGHVFHLACLLDYIKASKSDHAMVETLQVQATSTDGGVIARSVGAKVAHAQVIRSALKSGCPVCVVVEGA